MDPAFESCSSCRTPRGDAAHGLPDDAICADCGYELKSLSERRCPECAREFDPADPFSFHLAREVSKGRRRLYDVYHHERYGYDAVKQGFCWPAFFFPVPWAFIKEQWWYGLAMFVVLLVLDLYRIELLPPGARSSWGVLVLLAPLFAHFMFGRWANARRRTWLERNDYRRVRTVPGGFAADAVRKVAPRGTAIRWRAHGQFARTFAGWALVLLLYYGRHALLEALR